MVKFFNIHSKEIQFPLPESQKIIQNLPKPLIVLNPFSRGNTKGLNNEQIDLFCQKFLKFSQKILLIGKNNYNNYKNCINLVNKTNLNQLNWLFQKADFIISVDSGPMHLAAAQNCNLLSLHNWTNPAKVGPYNPNAWVWKNQQFAQIKKLPKALCQENRKQKIAKNSSFINKNDITKIVNFVLAKVKSKKKNLRHE